LSLCVGDPDLQGVHLVTVVCDQPVILIGLGADVVELLDQLLVLRYRVSSAATLSVKLDLQLVNLYREISNNNDKQYLFSLNNETFKQTLKYLES